MRIPGLNEGAIVKSGVFIIPLGGDLYRVGSTYFWRDKTEGPTEAAKTFLLERLESFMTLPYEIVSHMSGVRPTVSDRRPLVGQHPEHNNLFVLNGMGSRGVMTAPTAANALYKYIYEKFEIFLIVPNKKKVLDKVKNANESSEYITDHMTEDNILDKDELNKYFLAFKQDIIKNKDNDWDEIYLSPKENLVLRFHQELITHKTSTLIEEGNKSFLWGCKCRSGKTYMFGGVIIKQLKVKNKLNVLIITPAPTETSPQFTNDLFNKFKDFDKFKIHHIEGSTMINCIETSDNNIFIMSKQLLQKYINDKTIMKIKNLKLDIIGFDENHFSGTTDLSKSILDSYSSKNTIKVYLTATYNKPLREWNMPEECQMFWDIEDEQICKSILVDESNVDKLKEKHGDTSITATIKYFTNKGLSLTDMFTPLKI